MRADRTLAVVGLLGPLITGGPAAAASPPGGRTANVETYRRLVEGYRSGNARSAAEELAAWPRKRLADVAAGPRCEGRERCRAAAVLDLHAAALLLAAGRDDDAAAWIEAGGALVRRPPLDERFSFAWHLAAGYLQQAYGGHARAFACYTEALSLRPRDPSALLARATALEFSALADGFGGRVVADRDVWPFLGAGGKAPPELSFLLSTPGQTPQYQRWLLEALTVQYRRLLELDGSLAEARLRLARVLEARGHREEAIVEMRSAAETSGDPFVVAIAQLCLGRLAAAPDAAAAAYREATLVDPSLRPAWLGLSHTLHGQGDREGALAALEHAFLREGAQGLSAWVDYHLGRGRAFPAALAALQTEVAAR